MSVSPVSLRRRSTAWNGSRWPWCSQSWRGAMAFTIRAAAPQPFSEACRTSPAASSSLAWRSSWPLGMSSMSWVSWIPTSPSIPALTGFAQAIIRCIAHTQGGSLYTRGNPLGLPFPSPRCGSIPAKAGGRTPPGSSSCRRCWLGLVRGASQGAGQPVGLMSAGPDYFCRSIWGRYGGTVDYRPTNQAVWKARHRKRQRPRLGWRFSAQVAGGALGGSLRGVWEDEIEPLLRNDPTGKLKPTISTESRASGPSVRRLQPWSGSAFRLPHCGELGRPTPTCSWPLGMALRCRRRSLQMSPWVRSWLPPTNCWQPRPRS